MSEGRPSATLQEQIDEVRREIAIPAVHEAGRGLILEENT